MDIFEIHIIVITTKHKSPCVYLGVIRLLLSVYKCDNKNLSKDRSSRLEMVCKKDEISQN